MNGRLRALRLVHPFPSLLNSGLVAALATIAGADTWRALALGVGMLGLQLCIGATNDICDRELDARTKPWKPIPAGLVSVRTALTVAVAAGAIGVSAASVGGPLSVALALAMLACGLAYDIRLKATPFAWICFSIAFALLPIYAWYGAVGTLPPLAGFLVPLAAIAGPYIQLANGLVDIESDERGGIATLATRLGRRGTLLVMAALIGLVYGLAWLTLILAPGDRAGAPAAALVAVAGGTLVALAGYVLSTRAGVGAREAGWGLQAGALCLLGLGWLSAVS